MDGAGITIGAIAGVGLTAGMNAPAAAGVSPPPQPPGGMMEAASAGVVVTLSNAAMQAFAVDAASSMGGPPAQLADDLAALALLAILEHNRQQYDPLAAVAAYLAVQAMSGG